MQAIYGNAYAKARNRSKAINDGTGSNNEQQSCSGRKEENNGTDESLRALTSFAVEDYASDEITAESRLETDRTNDRYAVDGLPSLVCPSMQEIQLRTPGGLLKKLIGCNKKSCVVCAEITRRKLVAHFLTMFRGEKKLRFITLTIDPSKMVSKDLEEIDVLISWFWSKLRKRWSRVVNDLKFLVTKEYHETGYPHLHIVANVADVEEFGRAVFETGFGIVYDYQDIEDDATEQERSAVIGYCLKYALKAEQVVFNKRMIYCPKGFGYYSKTQKYKRLNFVGIAVEEKNKRTEQKQDEKGNETKYSVFESVYVDNKTTETSVYTVFRKVSKPDKVRIRYIRDLISKQEKYVNENAGTFRTSCKKKSGTGWLYVYGSGMKESWFSSYPLMMSFIRKTENDQYYEMMQKRSKKTGF